MLKYQDLEKLLPKGIKEYVNEKFRCEIDCLYYPDIYILPITEEGELFREFLIKELKIYRYGAYSYNLYYNNDIFVLILVNND